MFHRLYIHVVWTTRDRAALIDAAIARELSERLPTIAGVERADMLALGIVDNHVHVLLKVHPTIRIPSLMQKLKGSTAHAANRVSGGSRLPLKWAKGYSITTVSERTLAIAVGYVRLQHRRHPDHAIDGWPPPHG